MEVLIKECPACGAVVMGDESVCSGCGKQLPAIEPRQNSTRSATAPAEASCPRCGMNVPRGVLRCRDCGTYMSPEVEAAAMAQQANRIFTPGGSSGGLVGGGAGFGSTSYFQTRPANPATSSFAEVADDADFDLEPEVDLIDANMRDLDEGQVRNRRSAESSDEDDFELGDGTGAVGYGATNEPSQAPAEPVVAPTQTASAPVESAAVETSPTDVPSAQSNVAPLPEVPHSVETGGDILLDAALAEQREAAKRAKSGRRRHRRTAVTAASGDHFLVYCPMGHRIQVHEKHRGRTGRCPNCKALFFVPLPTTIQTLGEAGGQTSSVPGANDSAQSAGGVPVSVGYSKWITDVHLHRLNPSKLKLKPGSLEADYDTGDLGACPEHLLLAVVFSGSGPFRARQEPKKKPATRQAMLEHLKSNKPLAELPVPRFFPLTPDLLTQLKIIQPSVPGEESLFADVPVFGEGRIAIRVPAADSPADRAYLSFTLTQFRQLSQTLAEVFGLADYGSGTSIPLADEFAESACHYSEAVIRSLAAERLSFYRADSAIKLVVVGRRCEKCGLTISEDSRKKEKIGGKTDASIAKSLCPKCKAKFGNMTLYGFPPST